ncbi:MAG TPA: putative Ig domain-containing protein [Urbifossiella sp.]|nr:putative Ig domain-containing protein [Urbifossiella sp.]
MLGTTLKSWLARRPQRPIRNARKNPPCRLQAEALEARDVPAVFTWTPTLPGQYAWDDAANWSSTSGGFPNAAGDVANLTANLVGNQTIALDTDITVGSLALGSGGTSGTYTIVANGGSLNFDVASGTASIIDQAQGGDAINAPIGMNGDLNVSSNGTHHLAIGGAISGSGTVAAIGTILQTGTVGIGSGVTLTGTGTFAPTPVLYATSYYDGALYEFNESTGDVLATLAPPNSGGLLQFASGVVVGPDGNLYIANESPDPLNPSDSILQYNVTTQSLSTFISTAQLEAIATAQGAAYFNPSGIIFNGNELYVSLNAGFGDGFSTGGVFHGNVIRFDTTNSGGSLSYANTFTVLASTALAQPAGLAFGVNGSDAHTLYVNTAGTDNATSIPNADGTPGVPAVFISPAAAASAGLEFPSGLAWGPDGKMYVADLGAFDGAGQVARFNSDGSFDEKFVPVTGDASGNGSLGLQFPYGILFDAQGNMLLANFGNNGPTTSHPHDFIGSIYEYSSSGTFAKALISSSQFPQTGSDPATFNGIVPSQMALTSAYAVTVDGTVDPVGVGAVGTLATGGVNFTGGSTYAVDVFATAPGGVDRLLASGNVDLGGSTLSINPNQVFPVGTQFTILQTTGANVITGTFGNGPIVTVGTQEYAIGYSANAVTLTVVQSPLFTSADNATFFTGKNNSFQVTASGDPTPTLGFTGSLPGGLSFDSGTGILSGTPTAPGSPTISFTATNPAGTVTQLFTLTVNLGVAPAITSADNDTFTVGSSGTFTVTTMAAPNATISDTGSLPAGTGFLDNGDGTATLFGTPSPGTGGTYVITITASNGIGADATQTFTLNVLQAPQITSVNSATFTENVPGSFGVVAVAVPTAALSESGALPNGVTFVDQGNGTAALAGTPALGSGGTYPITITASNGVSPDATQSFTLTVDQAPQVTSGNAATFTVGTLGSFDVTASGIPAANLSEIGSLPSGVTFVNHGDGTATLSGTPATGTGGTFVFTITASNGVTPNATQSFTLTIDEAPRITSANSAAFTENVAGSFTVTVAAFPAATISETGALPGGVTFVDNANGTATLAGTPDLGSGGTYSFTITAGNGIGTDATQSFTLMVQQAPAITSGDAATFTVGSLGSFTVTTTGVPNVAFAVTSGSLPAGVNLIGNADGTATLTGTPAAGTGGSYTFTIAVSNGVSPDATQDFTLTVDQAPAITSANNATFTENLIDSFSVTSTGFPAAALSESGSLPPGVTFVDGGSGTATLAGTPDLGSGGVYHFTITAANGVGADATQSFALTVQQAPIITSASSATFTVGSLGTFTAVASGVPTATLSETGALPAGVTFTDNGDGTATLTGTPAAGAGGDYAITIHASNGIGTDDSQIFTLTADQAPAITSGSSAAFTVGKGGTFTVTATGFPAPTFSAATTLPTGVTLNPATGTIAVDSTAAAGVATLTINASNGVGTDASQSFTLTVQNLVSLSPALAVGGSVDGKARLYSPNASGAFGSPIGTISMPGITGADIRATTGDVDGDGIPDTIMVTGPGVPIRVAVISGADNATVLVAPFDPFGGNFTGGGFVATGDFDGDNRDEFVVTPDQGGGPRISIFSLTNTGLTERANYFTIDPNFRGGARAAVGDINGDGVPDLAVAAGFGGGPRIVVINGTKALTTDGVAAADRLVGDFFAFGDALRNGAYLAIGDVNGDGFGDLIFGAGPGGGPEVLTISGKSLLTDGSIAAVANPLSNFFLAGDSSSRGGVRVATVNADGDSRADVAVATGSDEASFARVYLGKNFGGAEPTDFEQLDPFHGAVLNDGVFVG